MKVNAKEIEKEFKPVILSIIFETKEEMKAFKSLFEYSPITSFFRKAGLESSIINEAIPCKSHLVSGEWVDFVNKIEG